MISKPPVHMVIAAQCVAALVVVGVLFLSNSLATPSVVAGLLIAIIPYSYFALRVFKFRGAKAAMQVAQSFYRAEAGKFVTSAIGFALAFVLVRPIAPAALFAAYGLMILIQLIGAWWLNRPPAS
ncbi:MAG: ATP synthase subunit I [Sinobacterium sp.]